MHLFCSTPGYVSLLLQCWMTFAETEVLVPGCVSFSHTCTHRRRLPRWQQSESVAALILENCSSLHIENTCCRVWFPKKADRHVSVCLCHNYRDMEDWNECVLEHDCHSGEDCQLVCAQLWELVLCKVLGLVCVCVAHLWQVNCDRL